MNHARAGGLGLLAYGIGTPVAFMSIGAPGGAYDEHAVTTYLSSGHWALAFGLAYLGAFSALGLLAFASVTGTEPGPVGALLRGLGVAGAAAGVVGWFLVGGISVSFAEGGSVVTGVSHAVVYLVSEISNLVAVCASAFFVGVAAIVMAARLGGTMPAVLRWATMFAGVCGVFGAAFFTLFVFWLWAIGFGVWLVRSSHGTREGDPVSRLAFV